MRFLRRPILKPMTRKRLRRFREMKRAYCSLVLLTLLYVLSLGSELFCNSVPLIVRFEGETYFPVFSFVPEDVFTGSGRQTRPDYKALEDRAAFRDNPENRMVWPFHRYGPYEIIAPEAIRIPDRVTAVLTPVQRVGSVEVSEDLTVRESRNADAFFDGNGAAPAGKNLETFWKLPPELRRAIRTRFANRPAERWEQRVQPRKGEPVRMALATYRPRTTPPESVRITLREPPPTEADRRMLHFESDMQLVDQASAQVWKSLSETVQAATARLARNRFQGYVEPRTVQGPRHGYRIEVRKEEVRFPFRPVSGHPLGIDSAGRDVLARVIYGFRTSVTFGLILVVCSIALGVVIGGVQGYFGGLLDITGQRLIEIWSALPFLYVMILVGSVYGRSFGLLILCYGLFNWIGISYYMRAEFLRLRKQPFVEAAACLGLSAPKIMSRHILPNALVPIITFFPFSLVGAVGALAALDYLGFGLPPPTPSWGELLHQAQQFRWAWWLILYPSLALFCVMLMGVFVGEGVRNAYDPRRYSRLV